MTTRLCLESRQRLKTQTVSQKPEPKSKGTIFAEENRKLANTLSPEERQEMLGKALEMIYSAGKKKSHALRR